MKNSRNVYKHLADDKSRFIYGKRVLWSLTGDDRYIDELLDSLRDKAGMDKMAERMRQVQDRLIIRGAGNEYRSLKRWYPWLDCVCFADRDPIKQAAWEIDGHRVISTEEFYEKYADAYVLVNSSAYNAEICEELREHGIPDERIFNFGKFFHEICDTQYFEAGVIAPVEHEVFIDGGAYDGATSRRFASWCGGNYDRIHAFEPDEANCGKIRDLLRDLVVWERGLWDGEETLHFVGSGTQWGNITDREDAATIRTISIDQALNGGPATFIKLDVEGAEYRALQGAEQTIRRYHPRLAISVYHKPEDIFTLPELILSYSGDYRFYLRHYQMSRYETILYAV